VILITLHVNLSQVVPAHLLPLISLNPSDHSSPHRLKPSFGSITQQEMPKVTFQNTIPIRPEPPFRL
jgi:hypothetical protein